MPNLARKYYFCNLAALLLIPLALATPAVAELTLTDATEITTVQCGDPFAAVFKIADPDWPVRHQDVTLTLEAPLPDGIDVLFDERNDFKPFAMDALGSTVTVEGNGFTEVTTAHFEEMCLAGFPCEPDLEPVLSRISRVGFSGAYTFTATLSGPSIDTLRATSTVQITCPTTSPPAVIADKTDRLVADFDGDGLADPGDRVGYHVVLANLAETPAEGVEVFVPVAPDLEIHPDSVTGPLVHRFEPGVGLTVEIGSLDASATPSFTFEATVRPTAGALVACQGVITGGNFEATRTNDPATFEALDPTRTPIDRDPDLSISKTPGTATVHAGESIAWTLTARNLGTQGATGVVLTETVPAHASFLSFSSDARWVCTNLTPGSTCTLDLGQLPAQTAQQVDFAVAVSSRLPASAQTLLNTVTIADDGLNGPEVTLANNTAIATATLVGVPDLVLTKSDGGVSARPGETILYRLTVANQGTRGSSRVVLEDTVPDHGRLIAGASDPRWQCPGGTGPGQVCTLELGELAAGGASSQAVFAVEVDAALPAGVEQIVNTASARDEAATEPDPTPEDNRATEITPLVGATPDVEVAKTASPATSVRPGGLIVWTLTVSNTGNQEAVGVVLEETVPAETSFDVAASDPVWDCPGPGAGSVCTWTIPSLPAGEEVTADFAVVVAEGLPAGVDVIENCAQVGSAEGCSGLTVEAAPDLGVTKDDRGATVLRGEEVTYRITYENSGNQAATGVVLEDTLPAGTALVAQTSDPRWSCTPGPRAPATCTLDLGSVAPAESGTVALTLRVSEDLGQDVKLLTNRVVIADDATNGPDPTPEDNQATETTPIEPDPVVEPPGPGEAALEVTLTDILALDGDADGGASAGDTLVYVVRVLNASETSAEAVRFEVAPDSATELRPGAATTSQGAVVSGLAASDERVAVELGELAGGAGADVTFEVVVGQVPPSRSELVVQGVAVAGNAPEELSDDPETPVEDDPTVTPLTVGDLSPVDIPTVGEVGLVLLVVLLSAGGMVLLRRRRDALGAPGEAA